MFTRLYFDTSELVAAGWPRRLSADLDNVLTLTRNAQIGRFLPRAVEVELQQQWQRELEDKTTAVRASVQAVETHLRGIQQPSMSVSELDLTKAGDD